MTMSSCLPKLTCFKKDECVNSHVHIEFKQDPQSEGIPPSPSNSEKEKLKNTEEWLKSLSNILHFDVNNNNLAVNQDISRLKCESTYSRRKSLPCKMATMGSAVGNKELNAGVKPMYSDGESSLSSSSDSSLSSSSASFITDRYFNKSNTCSDFSSLSSDTTNMPIETFTLNLSEAKCLGMTVIGHVVNHKDCGLFVGTIKKGGAAHQSGKVEPGDMILSANGIDITRLSNTDALAVLREQATNCKYLTIVVGKYWCFNDSNTSFTKTFSSTDEPKNERFFPGCNFLKNPYIQKKYENKQSDSTYNVNTFSSTNKHHNGSLILETSQHRQRLDNRQFNFPKNSTLSKPMKTQSSSNPVVLPSSVQHSSSCNCLTSSFLNNHSWANVKVFSEQHMVNFCNSKHNGPNTFLGLDFVEWIKNNVTEFHGSLDKSRNYADMMLRKGYIQPVNSKVTAKFSDNDIYVNGVSEKNSKLPK